MRKKVAFFIPSLQAGGVEKIFCNLSNSLIEFNYDITFVLCYKEGSFKNLLDKKIKIVDFGNTHLRFSFFKYREFLKREKPDYIICGPHFMNIVSILANFSLLNKSKLIATHHNFHDIETIGLGIHGRYLPFLTRLIYPLADVVVCVSSGIKNYLISLGIPSNKLKVIYNPIIHKNLFLLADEIIFKNWCFSDMPYIVSVGRLEKVKNFELLIRAFKIVLTKKKFKLIIVGEGTDRSRLNLIIQELNLLDYVFITGYQQNPYNYIKNSSLFVLPSFSEALPTVIVESLALGVNVVSTDTSGAIEILDGGKFGMLTPINDVEAMGLNIINALENPMDSSVLKERAHLFLSEKVSIEYTELFETL